jgi:hypothetical protein
MSTADEIRTKIMATMTYHEKTLLRVYLQEFRSLCGSLDLVFV